MPDGRGFVSGSPDEGLTTWDLGPLWEYRQGRTNEEIPILDRDKPELRSTVIEGPQVGLVLSFNGVGANVLPASSKPVPHRRPISIFRWKVSSLVFGIPAEGSLRSLGPGKSPGGLENAR